jgi:hypothetical protein
LIAGAKVALNIIQLWGRESGGAAIEDVAINGHLGSENARWGTIVEAADHEPIAISCDVSTRQGDSAAHI